MCNEYCWLYLGLVFNTAFASFRHASAPFMIGFHASCQCFFFLLLYVYIAAFCTCIHLCKCDYFNNVFMKGHYILCFPGDYALIHFSCISCIKATFLKACIGRSGVSTGLPIYVHHRQRYVDAFIFRSLIAW